MASQASRGSNIFTLNPGCDDSEGDGFDDEGDGFDDDGDGDDDLLEEENFGVGSILEYCNEDATLTAGVDACELYDSYDDTDAADADVSLKDDCI